MIVTKIEAVTKTKYKIYVDEQFAFVVYKGELSRYHLKEEQELEQTTFDQIKQGIIKRAKLRAMHLLTDMNRTETELRTKLKQGNYTEDVIDAAVTYVKSFGYINDEQYAVQYLASHGRRKSRREIYAALIQKGVSSERLDDLLNEYYNEAGESTAIRAIMDKRKYNPETATEADRQKLYQYLARKGFRYDDIQKAMEVSMHDA